MNKYISITKEIKPELNNLIKKRNLRIEDFARKINYAKKFKSNKEAIDFLRNNINNFKEPENNKCLFFENNKANIVKSEKRDVFLYCSENNKERFCLTIDSIFIAFEGNNFGMGIAKLLSFYGIDTEEEAELRRIRKSYERNLEVLRNKNLKTNFPNLFKRIGQDILAIQKFYHIAKSNLMKIEHTLNGEHVFFTSLRFFAQKMQDEGIFQKTKLGKEPNRTKASSIINYLVLLGFVEKIKIENIPEELASWIQTNANHMMDPSYYIIKELNQKKLEDAENKIIKIDNINRELKKDKTLTVREKQNLTISTISKMKITQHLGQSEALRVYPNNIIKRTSNEEGDLSIERIIRYLNKKQKTKNKCENYKENLSEKEIDIIEGMNIPESEYYIPF